MHELQDERGLSALYLATHQDGSVLTPQHQRTDGVLVKFDQAFGALAVGPELSKAVAAAQADLAGLADVRTHVIQRQSTVDEAFASYDDAITKLFRVLEVYSSESSFKSLELHRLASANFEITEVKENLAQTRSLVTGALLAGGVSQDAYGKLRAQAELLNANLDQFLSDAEPIDRTRYGVTQGGPELAVAHAMEAKVLEVGRTGGTRVIGDAPGYYASAASATDNLVAVERSTNEALIARAQQIADDAQRKLLVYAGGSFLALVIATALALLVGRSLAQPLRRLTETAKDIADERLPAMVDAIQNGVQVDTVLPRLPVRSRDEIGQLTEAFNSVQQVAMDVTTEQASLRKSIGDMFVNLGRRNQSLIDRQLELIDELEATERDADSLQNLFALDHLVTRMRRNAENLLVLSGEEPPRKWGQALPLVDVIRAAVSEVQDYARVDVLSPDDLMVGGHVATDIAHLLAELVENATNFSPPTTRVKVRVERAENRTLVSVIDQGIGMTDIDIEAANERLASPPATDLTLARCLGFYVIGRLARRTGVAVRLGRSSGGGVLAQVALGSELVSLSGQPSPARMPDIAETLTDSPSATKDRLLGALGAPPEDRLGVRSGGPASNGSAPHPVGSSNGSPAGRNGSAPVPPATGQARSSGIYPLDVNGDDPSSPARRRGEMPDTEWAPTVPSPTAPSPTLPSPTVASPTGPSSSATGLAPNDRAATAPSPTGPHSSPVTEADTSSGLPSRRATDRPSPVEIPPIPVIPATSVNPVAAAPAPAPDVPVVPTAPSPTLRPSPVVDTPVAPPLAAPVVAAPAVAPVASPVVVGPPTGSWPPPPSAAPVAAPGAAGGPAGATTGLPRREAVIAARDDRQTTATRPAVSPDLASVSALHGEPEHTAAGLPQRRAGASPRPGAQPATTLLASTGTATERSPEEVRAMLSRFRTGVERGRSAPAAPEQDPDSQEDR